MSTDFADELAALSQGAANGTTPHTPESEDGPSMDDVWSQGIDKDQINQNKADALLPVGSYVSAPPFTVQMNDKEDERSKRPANTIARFFGRIILKSTERDVAAGKAKTVGEVLASGAIGFQVSPIRADKVDQDGNVVKGKPDRATMNYTQAYDAYKVAFGKDPNSPGDVLKYLRDYPVGIRVQQFGVPTKNRPEPDGDPGNYVGSIFPIREPKG